jgi:hypothetical protein
MPRKIEVTVSCEYGQADLRARHMLKRIPLVWPPHDPPAVTGYRYTRQVEDRDLVTHLMVHSLCLSTVAKMTK